MEDTAEADKNLLNLFGKEPVTLTSYQNLLREIAGGKKETPASSWLPELAKLSLSVLENHGKTRGTASAGCHFNKAVVSEAIHMIGEGKGKKEISQRLEGAFFDYALVAAAPLAAMKDPDHSLRNQLLDTFINVNLRGKHPLRPTPVFSSAYSKFNQTVQEDSLAVQQGIIGEVFAYLFLKQAGYTPSLSSITEDLIGTDFYLTQENGLKVPIQIKTGFHSKSELIDIFAQEDSSRIFIFLNPEGILRNPDTVKALFGEESPNKSSIISFAKKMEDALTRFYPSKKSV